MEERNRKSCSIAVKDDYLRRDGCIGKARQLLGNHSIEGMTEGELASEIYFHAWAFHISEWFEKRRIRLFSAIKKAADPIDLADGGDLKFRKLVYSLFWMFPGRKN